MTYCIYRIIINIKEVKTWKSELRKLEKQRGLR
nr:MAG TPA: hypothetical protein [Caudoviricetes sp.]